MSPASGPSVMPPKPDRPAKPTRPHAANRMGSPPGSNAAWVDPDTIGGRIRAARLARNLSQLQLAGMLDPPTHQPRIGGAEASGDSVARELVVRIARALAIDPCDLDISLAPARSITLARVSSPGKGVGWEPLRPADKAKMDELWVGDGPESEGPTGKGLGALVELAAADGIAVVLRGDLPVRDEGDER